MQTGGEAKASASEALDSVNNGHKVALVIGVTGIVGNHLLKHLLQGEGGPWQKVFGVSRKPCPDWMPTDPKFSHIQCDIGNADDVLAKLSTAVGVSHIFYATWTMESNEDESCKTNGGMLENVIGALAARGAALRHVALTTGTKHYLGPFDLYGKLEVKVPFKEDAPRLPHANFYYTLEDILFAKAKQHNFNWSIHRPFSIIGFAPGNLMNLGTTLAVYASICKYTGEPFEFPGSQVEWDGLNDVSDADLVAEHEIWASTTKSAANEAYNVVNGDVFRWRDMWPKIAEFYDLPPAPYSGHPTPLQEKMKGKEKVWDEIVDKHGLKRYKLHELAVWWHADADLGRPIEAYNDMSKSREKGFTKKVDTAESFKRLFQKLRSEKYTL